MFQTLGVLKESIRGCKGGGMHAILANVHPCPIQQCVLVLTDIIVAEMRPVHMLPEAQTIAQLTGMHSALYLL
jgi:hypothetical protein